MRAVAMAAGLLLAAQAGPALACRGPMLHRYYVLNAPPAPAPPDALVLEIAHGRLSPDRRPYRAFTARVVRVLQGRYRGSMVIVEPIGGTSCTYPSEFPEGPRRFVVGQLVLGKDGVRRLRPRAMRPMTAR